VYEKGKDGGKEIGRVLQCLCIVCERERERGRERGREGERCGVLSVRERESGREEESTRHTKRKMEREGKADCS
jgi:hypothetical protein